MLLYVTLGAVAAVLVARWSGAGTSSVVIIVLWAAAAAILSVAQWGLVEIVVGHAARNRPLRAVTPEPADGSPPDPESTVPVWQRWYIEARSSADRPPYSCSFVEFDERGDYLDFWQHRHAYQKILSLKEAGGALTVVMYVHGWRHSGQSHDVVAFNNFLGQLSAAEAHSATPRRVHGVYLAWRGAALKHVIAENDAFAAVTAAYGDEIVGRQQRARFGLLTAALETLSYFDRKSVPEYKFSGTQLSRTVFSCAFAAKRSAPDAQVLLIGHSFGGLMLERTVQNAAIGELTEAWPWGLEHENPRVNPLPFDTILILNSAAPSIYAKQFQSYLAAHRQAMIDQHVRQANTPFVFSLTSAADWATGVTHPIANSLSFLVPSLRRKYAGSDFALERVDDAGSVVIPQYYYYRHTPGHNPLLVNRFIEQVESRGEKAGASWERVHRNLAGAGQDLTGFETTNADKSMRRWRIVFPPEKGSVGDRFSRYRTWRPLVWTEVPPNSGKFRYRETAYWILRCPKEIINGHNDIWSQAAMDTYAALHRIAMSANDPSTAI